MTTPTRKPRAQKLGPGELTLGETGTLLDLSCQITEVTISWDSDSEDDVPVLCGGTMTGDETFTATLDGTVIQDMSADGVIDWTWTHKGEVHPIKFTPTSGDAEVRGEVKVMPVDLGGEIGKKNTSDLGWNFVGEPTFTPLSDPTDLDAAE